MLRIVEGQWTALAGAIFHAALFSQNGLVADATPLRYLSNSLISSRVRLRQLGSERPEMWTMLAIGSFRFRQSKCIVTNVTDNPP